MVRIGSSNLLVQCSPKVAWRLDCEERAAATYIITVGARTVVLILSVRDSNRLRGLS